VLETRSHRPSIAELRAVVHPPGLLDRNSGEHWAGRLYIRRASPYVTRELVRTPATPNGVTWAMIAVGILAAVAFTLPGIWGAILAFLLIQVQILLDCVDGEMARWLERKSPVGVFLDRIGHFLTEAALPIGLGIRADGGWAHIDHWTTLGLVVAVLVLITKSETALMHVARAESGRPLVEDSVAVAAPRGGLLRLARRVLGFVPFFRAFVAMELTLLALTAAVVDLVLDSRDATQVLVAALVVMVGVTAVGHLAGILASKRLH
jgi:phosphatidylglycerophosphate synthase